MVLDLGIRYIDITSSFIVHALCCFYVLPLHSSTQKNLSWPIDLLLLQIWHYHQNIFHFYEMIFASLLFLFSSILSLVRATLNMMKNDGTDSGNYERRRRHFFRLKYEILFFYLTEGIREPAHNILFHLIVFLVF